MHGAVIPFVILNNMYAIQQGSCPNANFLWEHTYDNRRFIDHTPSCVALEGTINSDLYTDDEDRKLHFNVAPGNGYNNLLNKNKTKGMVVEIICWVKYTDR